jgi:hypothetical protein
MRHEYEPRPAESVGNTKCHPDASAGEQRTCFWHGGATEKQKQSTAEHGMTTEGPLHAVLVSPPFCLS